MISGILDSSDFHSLFVFYGDTFPSDEILFGSPVWKQRKDDLFTLVVCVCTCMWCVCVKETEKKVWRDRAISTCFLLSLLHSHIYSNSSCGWGSNHNGFKTTYNIKVHLAIFKRRSILGKHIGLNSLPWLPVWVYTNYLTTLVLHLKTGYLKDLPGW